MAEIIFWLLTVEFLGFISFVLNFQLFSCLPDRGYSISKILGLLLISWPVWVLASLNILPNTPIILWMLLTLMTIISIIIVYKNRFEFIRFLKTDRNTIFLFEGIFLLFFGFWIIIRLFDPNINTTEQPMDFAFLNASVIADYFPPEDPWLRGNGVSYYYFGYLLMGNIAELAHIPTRVAYNLALALIPALSAVAVLGLGYNLIRVHGASARKAFAFSMLGPVVLLMSSNLVGILEFIRLRGLAPESFWSWIAIKWTENNGKWSVLTNIENVSWNPVEYLWWWRSTRVIDTLGAEGNSLDYTITEFPFFTFLLGDLHPHAMSIPFILLFLTFVFNFFIMPSASKLELKFKNIWMITIGSISLGCLGFINSWDIIPLMFIWCVVCIIKAGQQAEWKSGDTIKLLYSPMISIAVLSIFLYLPYYLNMQSQVSGILPVGAIGSRPIHLLLIWGSFFILLWPFIWSQMLELINSYKVNQKCAICGHSNKLLANACVNCNSDAKAGRLWLIIAISISLTAVPFLLWAVWHLGSSTLGFSANVPDVISSRFLAVLPILMIQSILVIALIKYSYAGSDEVVGFSLVILCTGLFLIIGAEFFRVDDLFHNRMNTIFKLYYQVWILFSVASPIGIYWVVSAYQKRHLNFSVYTKVIWSAVTVSMLFGSLYYSVETSLSRVNLSRDYGSLDGLTYLKQQDADIYQAVLWLNENLETGDGLLEGIGRDYDSLSSIFSSSTGFATVLGWPGHEHQWRGTRELQLGRENHIEKIYTTDDIDEALSLLRKYDIDYIVVGPREVELYGNASHKVFNEISDIVFSGFRVSIYKINK